MNITKNIKNIGNIENIQNIENIGNIADFHRFRMNLCVNGWYFEVEPSHHWPDIGAGGAVDAAGPGRRLNKKMTH